MAFVPNKNFSRAPVYCYTNRKLSCNEHYFEACIDWVRGYTLVSTYTLSSLFSRIYSLVCKSVIGGSQNIAIHLVKDLFIFKLETHFHTNLSSTPLEMNIYDAVMFNFSQHYMLGGAILPGNFFDDNIFYEASYYKTLVTRRNLFPF